MCQDDPREARKSMSQTDSLYVSVRIYLESQARLDLVSQNISNCLVEVCEDLHGELWLDSPLADEVVQCICERASQATEC